jgi:hypothetical protein
MSSHNGQGIGENCPTHMRGRGRGMGGGEGEKILQERRLDSVADDRTIGNFFLSSWNHVILSVLPKLLKIFGPDKTKIPILVNLTLKNSFNQNYLLFGTYHSQICVYFKFTTAFMGEK